MRRHAVRLSVFAALAAIPIAHAATTETSYREARAVLDGGIAAMGGSAALEAIKDLRRSGSATAYAQGQSLSADGPLAERRIETQSVIDVQGGRARTETATSGAGIVTARTLQVLDGEQGFTYNQVTRALTPLSPAAVANLRAGLRRDPAAILLTALARAASLRSLGEESPDGRRQRVITFADADGTQLTLSFDAATGLLSKLDTLADDAVLGDTLNELVLSDYRDVPVGASRVKLPFRQVTRRAGQTTQDARYAGITANEGLGSQLLAAPADAVHVPAAPPSRGVVADKLGEDVYHLAGGSHHSLAVGFKDQVVVVDGPLGEDRSQAVLAKVGELFPGKPLRVVMTHYHFDHSGGLRAYIARGVPIVTTPGNKAFLERMAQAPHTIRPDSLSREPKPPVVETFSGKKVLTDGARTLELHDIGPNPHVNEWVVAYLPKEKVLFVADVVPLPLAGPLPPVSAALQDFADKIAKLGLAIDRIAPGHGRMGTMEDVKAALAVKAP